VSFYVKALTSRRKAKYSIHVRAREESPEKTMVWVLSQDD